MAQSMGFGLALAALLVANSAAAVGQTVAGQASRIAGDWRSSGFVTIPQSAPPVLRDGPPAAVGVAPAGTRLERMILLLEPSVAQQQALTNELTSLRNSASPEYRQWLTPVSFAAAYSNSGADVETVANWLKSEGFEVAPLPAGLQWIEFSGIAAQVEQAFHTQVKTVAAAAGTRVVLGGDISVPAALRPLIHGLVSLDGTLSAPALTAPQAMKATVAGLAAEGSLNRAEAATPKLMAQLLHLDAVHASGTLGAGETIAIAARSNVRSSDIAAFRSAFSLPASALKVVANGTDPGRAADEAEAVMAASWAGAAAPGAQIALVPATTTAATDGLDLSLAVIVDQAPAHTAVVGYSACEAAMSETHLAFYAALYRQAAAEGIAVITAAGDSGAAACHAAGSEAEVTSGYGVNALAATPWNTAVGAAGFGTGRLAAWSPVTAADPTYAGGGGSSTNYAEPGWQAAQASVVAKNAREGVAAGYRLLPDLALPAALDSGASRGLAFCMSGESMGGGCTLVRAGGSSAAAALFAGIAALVAEKYGAQGNLAPHLYSLSDTGGIFRDVAEGNAQLKCALGSPGCGTTERIGFTAVDGYDLATGLGSVDAQALVTTWPRPEATTAATGTTTTTLAAGGTPAAGQAKTAWTLTATVTTSAATTSLTGTVSFYDGELLLATAAVSGTAYTYQASLTANLANNVSHSIKAVYSGDTNWTGSTSNAVTIPASTLADLVALTASNLQTDPGTGLPTAHPGQAVTLTAEVTPAVAPSTTDAEQFPTGYVDFYMVTTAGNQLLERGTLARIGLTDASAATYTTSTLPAGQVTLIAIYEGDLYYDEGISNEITIGVQDFSLTPDPTSPATNLDIVQGASGTATYDVKGLGGFQGVIQVVCAVPTQDLPMTCTASPQQVTPPGKVTFVVQTYDTGATAVANREPRNRKPRNRELGPMGLRAAGGVALALLGIFMLPFGRRARVFLSKGPKRFLVLLLLLIGLGGAGIGCNSVTMSGTESASGVTPLGVATLKITASEYVNNTVYSRSQYLTVNVLAKPQ